MSNTNKNYVLGLDLGIASVGWALMIKDDEGAFKRIENLGVRIFPSLEDKSGKLENELRREKRGQRRLRRRKQLRLSDARNLFKKYLNIDFSNLKVHNYRNPYELKIAGMKEALSKEELSIALYHYIKYRGFKSNRKVEDVKKEGVLLKEISAVEAELDKEKKTITEYLYGQFLASDPNVRRIHNVDAASSLFSKDENKSIRNKDDRYIFAADRSMYLKEIELILDKQISYSIITEDFKKDFIALFTRQRSFSKGPGLGSPYGAPEGMSLISKMIGTCSFDDNIRAPKAAFSSESFVLLSFLNNLQIKEKQESNYRSLTKEEIQKTYQFALKRATLTYANIFKELDLEVYRVKGYELSRNEYISLLKKYKEENGISGELNTEQFEKFTLYSREAMLKKNIISLSNYHAQRKVFEKQLKEQNSLKTEIQAFIDNSENFDKISEILLHHKVDDEIIKACLKNGYSVDIAEIVTTLPSVEKTINLSLDLCKRLIPLLKEGLTYDKAMQSLGYNHSDTLSNIEKHEYLPEINECMAMLGDSLTNPNVRHTLVEMRKIINAVIKKYGFIKEFNIEFSRDLARSFEDRRKISSVQKDNLSENLQAKKQLITQFPHFFKNFNDIKGDTLLKFQLYKEQNGKCAYSNKVISFNELFDANATQIDHIMPYSRTFENRRFNRVLVFTTYNQEKRNKLPREAFKGEAWQNILNFLADPNLKISNQKRETLLLKEINDEEWLTRNSNDTKYATVLAKKIISAFLKPEKCRAVASGITSKVKFSYGLTNLTHSYLNPEYKRFLTFNILDCKDIKNGLSFKLKDNHEEEHEVKIETKKTRGSKTLSFFESEVNEALNYFLKNLTNLQSFLENRSLNIDKLLEEAVNLLSKTNDENQSNFYEMLIRILTEIKQETLNISNQKDRSNHLHHILDAAVIAITDDKMIYRIQNYEKLKEIKFDEKTGEQLSAARFNLPYPEFRNEIIYRIYERSYETLIQKLKTLNNYKDYHFNHNDCYVVYPSRSINKNISGALTKDTIFGYNEKENKITKRISVNEITDKNIDSILNVSEGSNAQIDAIKEWIKNGKQTKFPILPGKNNFIKKITLIEADNPQKRVQLREKAFAANDAVIRIDIYKRKQGDGRLYFVPIYYYQIERERLLLKGHKIQNVNYHIMWGSGDNNKHILKDQLSNDFKRILILPRYSLIELAVKNGNKGICYSGGLTSGLMEIYSILGDDHDLLNYGFVNSTGSRCRPTISTINNIKLRSISILGKIS